MSARPTFETELQVVRQQLRPLLSPANAPRFANVFCSQCGGEFGPGDHGFSDCVSHRLAKLTEREVDRRIADRRDVRFYLAQGQELPEEEQPKPGTKKPTPKPAVDFDEWAFARWARRNPEARFPLLIAFVLVLAAIAASIGAA